MTRAAIYARYSSENQRDESIEDQIASCRRKAEAADFVILEDHVYADRAQSGAQQNRPGLNALREAAKHALFDIVLVDDFSRLTRSNHFLLGLLEEFGYHSVGVVSVADALYSEDEAAILPIQIRAIFNEQFLRDLRKKTLRGQIGQKDRGFFVGEATFGYRSRPSGEMRTDKQGRPRPEGYKMEIEPSAAATVQRIFEEYADGKSLRRIVCGLNGDGVPSRYRESKGWSTSTVYRMLRNTKYIGHWVWNKNGSRRDPQTGNRRYFEKPKDELVVLDDQSLRIIPQALWDRVEQRRNGVSESWPGGKGMRGFSSKQRGWVTDYPTHLLSGAMNCGECGCRMILVSGKKGGYYGCGKAQRGACDNRMRVARKLAEKVIVGAVQERIVHAEALRYVIQGVEKEVRKQYEGVPGTIRLKTEQLRRGKQQLGHLVDRVGEGWNSDVLKKTLKETEQRVRVLEEEINGLQHACDRVMQVPPVEWIEERLSGVRDVLEEQTAKSALLLRELLGPIRLECVKPDLGRPYYRAHTALDVLALLDEPGSRGGPGGGRDGGPGGGAGGGPDRGPDGGPGRRPDRGSDGGAKSFRWWRHPSPGHPVVARACRSPHLIGLCSGRR